MSSRITITTVTRPITITPQCGPPITLQASAPAQITISPVGMQGPQGDPTGNIDLGTFN